MKHVLLRLGVGIFAAATIAAQPTIISPNTSSIAPLGVGATTSELLFTQPFCENPVQSRGVYSVTNFVGTGLTRTATMSETIPLVETHSCAENYFMISTGSGGFTPGAVYSTGWNPNNQSAAIFKNGSLFIPTLNGTLGLAGITFDTVGTFNMALIATTNLVAAGYNAAGTELFSYPAPSGFFFESATVAPITYGPCPGCLVLTAESIAATNRDPNAPNGAIYVVKPGTPSGTAPTLVATTPGLEPESALFVSPQLCTLNGTNFSYFVSGFATGNQKFTPTPTNGALLAYTNTQIAPLAGQFIIPFEAGNIYTYNGITNTFTPFDSTAYQLEGASLVQCAPAAGCPATQGFWKHHAFPASMFNAQGQVIIGGVAYTSNQLVTILNTPPAGGDAALILMHQLIAALANISAGAQNVGVVENGVNVDLAISEAEQLLQGGLPQPGFPGSNPTGAVFPINFINTSGNFVQASTTLGADLSTLSSVLDAYNSAVGLNCQEGSGLNTGKSKP